MGLDNIPHNYPCQKQGTAVVDGNDLIDCKATQAWGGCPWKTTFGEMPGAVHGMLGTNCWYRGKFGNAVLSENLGLSDDNLNFYGDNEEGTYKSPASCNQLADAIEQIVADDDIESLAGFTDEAELKMYLGYAVAWLRWVAENCDGADAWY